MSGGYFSVIEWKFINCIRGKLVNLPDASKDILFKIGNTYHAGYFDTDEDNFGFYIRRDHEDDLVLAEEVDKWCYITE